MDRGASQPTPTPLQLARKKPVKTLPPIGSRRRRKLNDNNAGERQQAKRRTKVGKTNNQKGAKRVCRASKYLKDTQAIQHGLERSQKKKNNENEIARIEGVQCVLTGTNSVLL